MQRVVDELKARGFEVNVVDVVKNGVDLRGVNFGKAGDTVRPTLYEDNISDMLSTSSVNNVVDKMIDLYNSKPSFDVDNIGTVDYIKENCVLCIQQKGTEDIVKRDYLDLELMVRVKVDGGTYKAHTNILDRCPDVIDRAIENTRNTFIVKDMVETMKELMGDFNEGIYDDLIGKQYVVRNADMLHAASALYYPEVFKGICEKTNTTGCYILPSSIHELIVMPDYGDINADELSTMVRDVNRTTLDIKEVLSNHVYWYDINLNKVECR